MYKSTASQFCTLVSHSASDRTQSIYIFMLETKMVNPGTKEYKARLRAQELLTHLQLSSTQGNCATYGNFLQFSQSDNSPSPESWTEEAFRTFWLNEEIE